MTPQEFIYFGDSKKVWTTSKEYFLVFQVKLNLERDSNSGSEIDKQMAALITA